MICLLITDTEAVISWESKYGVGDEIPFEFSFFDANDNLVKDVIYAFGLIDPQGNSIQSCYR